MNVGDRDPLRLFFVIHSPLVVIKGAVGGKGTELISWR